MSKYLIQDTSLTSIADEVRILSDTTDLLNTNMMTTNLQTVNAEVATQKTLLEETLSLLETKTATIVENCNFELTLSNFGSNIVVMIYTYLNASGQIETTENDFMAEGTFTIPVLKNSQILFMGVSGGVPASHIDSGSVVSKRSFSDGNIYYAYSFACNGDSAITFQY